MERLEYSYLPSVMVDLPWRRAPIREHERPPVSALPPPPQPPLCNHRPTPPAGPAPGPGLAIAPPHAERYSIWEAARKGKADIVAYKLGSEQDLQNRPSQRTLWRGGRQLPLCLAAAAGSEPTVSVLLNHGANLNLRDTTGRNALHHAIRRGHSGVLGQLLRQKDAVLLYVPRHEPPRHAPPPVPFDNLLGYAIRKKQPACVRLIVNCGDMSAATVADAIRWSSQRFYDEAVIGELQAIHRELAPPRKSVRHRRPR